MNTDALLEVPAAELRPGDRVLSPALAGTDTVGPRWLGPFVQAVRPGPAVTAWSTVNGGENGAPSGFVLLVARGLDATGDPAEGY